MNRIHKLDDLLQEMVERGASDLYIKAGQRPCLRIDGEIVPTDYSELTMDESHGIATQLMTAEQAEYFSRVPEMDLAVGVRGVGRFRVNVFRQRGSTGLVFRYISNPNFSFEELNLPPAIKFLAEKRRGLVLVTGTTGSGKSTTLAAMVNHINQIRRCHIMSIEDPIEFLHQDELAIINQREVGFDTKSFSDALKHVLRQAPDVILIGEMRDLETISTAIAAAETGHLVLSTLHTIDAVQTVEGRSVVFVTDEKGFRVTPVLAGRRAGDRVEILNGLSGDERVAGSNAFLLKAELAKGEAEHGH